MAEKKVSYLENMIANKKDFIERNPNAQIVALSSNAISSILDDLRYLDAQDSTIKSHLGVEVEFKDAEIWVSELEKIKENITKIKNKGNEIIAKKIKTRNISYRLLRQDISKLKNKTQA
ncbi:hypothetical protein [Campylobacter sp. RM12651]|uniref:hypothetical protein n=1 Tax=Campylobacter sp. RM12651 TaxID=1660079 RepID=UPI001EFC22C8|nr:hypothetical protein [Campylobacter sp. RM12651]ULO03726.1 hypothetical protein AVBRAN_1271 [Campylobacter sp. RM12651]